MKQFKNLKIGFFLFSLFLIFSLFVHFNFLQKIDWQILTFLQKNIPRIFDLPFSYFSLVGSFEIATLILLLIVYFSSRLNKLSVLFFYALTIGIETVGKGIIAQIGPPLELLRTHFFLSFPTGVITEGFFAYPSGHTARTAFISIILLFIIWQNKKLNKKIKITFYFLLLTFNLGMFISRIYLAEHWFSDVVGGVLLGTSLSLVAIGKFSRTLFAHSVARKF